MLDYAVSHCKLQGPQAVRTLSLMYMLSSTYHRTRCFILLVLVAIRFAAGNHTVTHTIATPCQSGANSRSLLGATITTATSSSTSKVGANRDEYDGLVSTPSRVFGPTRKQAVLSPRKFDLSLFRVEQFREWLHNTTVTGGLSPLTTPPISQPCTVVVNHRLRYIYIRTRKTASSTVVRALEAAGACPGQSGENRRKLANPLRANI